MRFLSIWGKYHGGLFAYYQERDLQGHPCHQQYPEAQANLYLPSLQAPQGVLSVLLDPDDPAVGKGGGKKVKKSDENFGIQSGRQNICTLYEADKCEIDHSFMLPSFITGRRQKQSFKVKQEKKMTVLCTKSGRLTQAES